MTPARFALVLIVLATLAGCGGGGGSSTAATQTETSRAASATSCPGGLKTSDTCWFAEQTARAHAADIETFLVAGERMKCLGSPQHWFCWSTNRRAWVRQP
jgi:hypothetical protein